VLWGYWYTNYSSGRYAEAREIGEQLLAAARRGDDSGRLLEAHHALWATLLAMGQPSLALLHIERGIALYDRERHASQTMLYGNHDPGACCRYQLALSRWLLGYPDQALAAVRDAYRLVHELRHPLTTVITHWFVACIQYQRGERDAAAETTEQLVTLAAVYGFPTWTDAAIVLPHAVGKTRLGPEALAELHRRLNGMPGASWRKVFCLCVLAELYAEVNPEEGLRVLASIGETDRHAFLAPEVSRLEGELRLRSGERAANAAERCFHTAIELARRRLEKSLELRATASLARLWGQQDRRADAHRVLADVYAWFTEGFDTTDLRAAKGLLADLAG
jgi:tetratricopeptide (TPR) repeat protein